MPWIGPTIAVGGGLLQGAFGGSKDPGPSNLTQNSRKDAMGQSDSLKDAFFGSNWRGSLAGDPGINQAIDQGDSTIRSKFRYGAGGGASGGTPAGVNLYGGTTPYGNKPILQQLYDMSNQGIQSDQNALGQYGGAITRAGESGYRQAQKFGTGQSAVINSGADLALKNANALTLARANASGLGGATTTNDMLGANAAGIERGRQANLANVQDQATGMKVQQRNTQAAQQQALSGMYSTFADRANQLRAAPINAQMGVLQGSVANPFGVMGGQAPVGAQNQSLANVGNIASQYGGLLSAQQLYPNLFGSQGGTGLGNLTASGGQSANSFLNP